MCALVRILKKSTGNHHFINRLRSCLSIIYYLFNGQIHTISYKLNVRFVSLLSNFLCKALNMTQILRHWLPPSDSSFKPSFHSNSRPGLFSPILNMFHQYLLKKFSFLFPDSSSHDWKTKLNMLISAFLA